MAQPARSFGMLAVLALLCWGGPACSSESGDTKNSIDNATDSSVPPEVTAGLAVFQRLACDTCHSFNGRFKAGPALNDIYGKEVELVGGAKVLRDENYLKNSILDANAQIVQGYRPQMVNYDSLLQEGELQSLIALIKHHSTTEPASVENTY